MKKILSIILAVVLVMLVSLFGSPAGQEALPATEPAQIQAEITESAGPEAPPPESSEAPPAEIPTEAQTVPETEPSEETEPPTETEPPIDRDGSYTSKEDVALYIHTYGCLPNNFMTKAEARKLGWEGGGLDDYAYGMCIGGDRFGNYEGLLPEDREYRECDIGTLHKNKRGSKRIVFSDDGLIYYTDDHYESFELLYGEP